MYSNPSIWNNKKRNLFNTLLGLTPLSLEAIAIVIVNGDDGWHWKSDESDHEFRCDYYCCRGLNCDGGDGDDGDGGACVKG